MKLTEKERRIVEAVRQLEAEERRLAETPAALLEHGMMSPRRAAGALGMKLAELERLVAEDRIASFPAGLPISEVRRLFDRRRKAALRAAHIQVARLFEPAAIKKSLFDMLAGEPEVHGRSPSYAARFLGLSEREVRRLVEDDGPLFAQRSRRRGMLFTDEELEAFKRTLERDRSATAECKAA